MLNMQSIEYHTLYAEYIDCKYHTLLYCVYAQLRSCFAEMFSNEELTVKIIDNSCKISMNEINKTHIGSRMR